MSKEPDLILVTGATGKQGGAVAHELLDAGRRVRIMTRHPDSRHARALASRGAEVVKGDLDDNADIAGNAREFGIPPTSFADWANVHFAEWAEVHFA